MFDPRRPYAQQTTVIQKNVFGEADDQYYGVPPDQRVAPPAITDVAPSLAPPPAPAPAPAPQPAHVTRPTPHTEQPAPKPEVRAATVELGQVGPVSAAPQRTFSAPRVEWDATRYVP